jgi:hypothetical protein
MLFKLPHSHDQPSSDKINLIYPKRCNIKGINAKMRLFSYSVRHEKVVSAGWFSRLMSSMYVYNECYIRKKRVKKETKRKKEEKKEISTDWKLC